MTSLETVPNFTGTWTLNRTLSQFPRTPTPDLRVEIEHTGPHIVQRVHVPRPGAPAVTVFEFETTGEETVQHLPTGTARVRAHWIGPELVIESTLEAAGRELRFKDHWSLSSDGSVLTMAHRDDDLAGQTAVLNRTPTTPAPAA